MLVVRDAVLRVLVWGKEEGRERKGEAEMKRRALGESGERQRQVSTEQTAEVYGRVKQTGGLQQKEGQEKSPRIKSCE